MKLKIILIIVSIIAIIFAVSTEIRMLSFQKNIESKLNWTTNEINKKITGVNKELEKVDYYFAPDGPVEKYILASSFIKKQSEDIEKMLTQTQTNEKAGYIQLYISGSKEVWCSFKNSENKYIFQGNLLPGLNPYYFFFFKTPSVETKYTYNLDINGSFKSGNSSKVYFLIHEPGQYRIKSYPTEGISNIKTDLNLYIPTITGN